MASLGAGGKLGHEKTFPMTANRNRHYKRKHAFGSGSFQWNLNLNYKKGGIGEEDFVVITLPYINSAKEGKKDLALIEKYGTYESNGIAFQDVDSIWWFETIGGHH